jgi:hypothetical protein
MKVAEFAMVIALLLAEFALRHVMVELGIAAKLFAPNSASGLLNLLLAVAYLVIRLALILGLPTWLIWRWTTGARRPGPERD